MNKLPARELHPNKPADKRGTWGKQGTTQEREEKLKRKEGHSHKGFLKHGICETEQDAIKEKKKLDKQKDFLEIKNITEIKIPKVGDTTEKIFEKVD